MKTILIDGIEHEVPSKATLRKMKLDVGYGTTLEQYNEKVKIYNTALNAEKQTQEYKDRMEEKTKELEQRKIERAPIVTAEKAARKARLDEYKSLGKYTGKLDLAKEIVEKMSWAQRERYNEARLEAMHDGIIPSPVVCV
jgi:hypothetical protein